MTTTVEPELEVVVPDEAPPVCAMVYDCETHGEEHCAGRARWIAVVQCPDHPSDPCERVPVCDRCRDDIIEDGNMLGEHKDHKVLEWIEL